MVWKNKSEDLCRNILTQRVREVGGADCSYASDYDIVARLKALADSYKVTMLIVHHTRKQKSEDIFDMISGTNGLMGAVDGAFVLSKEKRTSNNATLDVAGRDQQDMKIHLVRDTERLVWNFEKSETELWKEPPEPLLEKIAETLFSESDKWEEIASGLCKILEVDIKPNVLSLRLSISASRLFRDYGIRYCCPRPMRPLDLNGRIMLLSVRAYMYLLSCVHSSCNERPKTGCYLHYSGLLFLCQQVF